MTDTPKTLWNYADQRNLKLVDIARRMGMNEQSVRRWMNNTVPLPAYAVRPLAAVLRQSVSTIIDACPVVVLERPRTGLRGRPKGATKDAMRARQTIGPEAMEG